MSSGAKLVALLTTVWWTGAPLIVGAPESLKTVAQQWEKRCEASYRREKARAINSREDAQAQLRVWSSGG
jgi:hypothetical protein